MPSLPVIADVFRVVFNWEAGALGAAPKNVLHVYSPTLDPEGVAGVIDSETDDGVFAGLSSLAVLSSIDVQPLDGVSAASVYGLSGGWRDGAGGTDYMPSACALVSLRTGLAGRSNHGRIYLPFLAESEVTQGTLVSATVSTMQSSWVATRTAWAAADVTLGVASYVGAGAFHPVSTLTVEAIAATQRRRLRR